ncbi:hypothetical protein BZG36_05153 [Bifiguratus adelaidae]|uniref:Galactose oxidase-like Early set domain-containing protein n=1 Tax=Bifiguratus adelaidae TaxID=1938954 RepID=A0A261XU30_9FUNG|nr:hypothetical protein BZG36_05153 [Bifiguratus adelaidae]
MKRSLKVLVLSVLVWALLPSLASSQAETDNLQPNNTAPPPTVNVPVTVPDPTTFPQLNGTWQVIGKSGIPGVHLALLTPTKMMIINRVDTASPFLPGYTSPYSSLYDLTTNSFDLIPFLKGQPGCATGVFHTNGTLVTTGGKIGGSTGAGEYVRAFTYDDTIGVYNRWDESYGTFTTYRWYSSAVLMPDNSILFVGGSLNATITPNLTNPTYEFMPNPNPNNQPTELPFLTENLPWVLYPALYVMPDGNVFIFVNQGAQLWNPYNNTVIKRLPNIPGSPRTYPLTGSAIMLPLRSSTGWRPEFLVCGGSTALKQNSPADPTCGRISPLDANPTWEMDTMPYPRLMPDSMVLPTGKILFINGAMTGFAGYGKTSMLADVHAMNPVYNPVMYDPDAPLGSRWSVLPPSTLPRMYHSAAYLLPDGRVFVAGSSSNDPICVVQSTNCTFPTLFDIEAFSPPYMLLNAPVPIITAPSAPWVVGYNKQYQFTVSGLTDYSNLTARLINNGFTTHSNHFDQRAVELDIQVSPKDAKSAYISFTTPPNSSVVPPTPMFYLYVVSGAGKPSVGVQVSFDTNAGSQSTPSGGSQNSTTTTSTASSLAGASSLVSLLGFAIVIFFL